MCLNVCSLIMVTGHPVSTMNFVDIEFIVQTPLIPPYDLESHTLFICVVCCDGLAADVDAVCLVGQLILTWSGELQVKHSLVSC